MIESSANGYYINRDFHIMTDLQQFDMLWEQALHAVTIPHKVELLKQAVDRAVKVSLGLEPVM